MPTTSLSQWGGYVVSMGSWGVGHSIWYRYTDVGILTDCYAGGPHDNVISGSLDASLVKDDKWHHFYQIIVNGTNNIVSGTVYVDGEFAYSGYGYYAKNTGTNYAPQILACTWYNNAIAPFYISTFRVYNRALTDEEISDLASELTPTT